MPHRYANRAVYHGALEGMGRLFAIKKWRKAVFRNTTSRLKRCWAWKPPHSERGVNPVVRLYEQDALRMG